MKRNNALILMVLAGMLVASGTAFAADATTAVDINSAYVWRGMTFNDGLVVQPSVNVVSGGFGLNVWGNLDVDDYDDTLKSGEFSEVDLTLSYTHQAGPVAITAGYIEYMFPTIKTTTIKESEEVTREAFEGGALGTREVYLDAIVKPVDGVSVGLASYYDFDEVEDYYLNPYLGYGMELMPKLSMSLRAGAGYAGKDFAGSKDPGFFDYTLSMGLTYAVMDNVSLSGRLAYTDSIDKDVLVAQDTNFYGGAGVAVTF